MSTHVLVVEADRSTGELIATVLARDGLVVTVVRDAEQARERLAQGECALVLCAADLPGVDCGALLPEARQRHVGCRIAVLLPTEDGDSQTAAWARDGVCDLVLGRPFRYHRLKPDLVRWGLVAGAPISETAVAAAARERIDLGLPPPPLPPSIADIEPASLGERSDAVSPPPADGLVELDLDDLTGSAPPPAPGAPIEIRATTESLPGGLAATGDIATHPLGRLLFELYVGTFTGVLRLRRLGRRRSVYVDGGLPIHVESDQMAESLGRLLIEHGRITQESYAAAQALVEERQCRFGEALIELGTLGRGDLLDALLEQTEIKLANSFAWRSGNYALEPLSDLPHHVVATEVHPLKAIWRGVSENYDAATLLAYFTPLRSRFAVTTELFSVHYDTLGPFLRQLDLPQQLDGRRTFGALLDGPASDRQRQLSQALYVLLTADMIRADERPGKGAILPDGPLATPSTQATSVANAAALSRIGEEIAREYLRIKDGDYFDVLRVEVDATAAEVDAAYGNASRPWRLQDLPPGLANETLSRVREVGELLARARNVLRDPTLRERYIASQRQKFAPASPTSSQATAAAISRPPMMGRTLELDTDAGRRQQSSQAERAYNEGLALLGAGNLPGAEIKLREATRLADKEPDYWAGLAQVALTRLIEGDASARESAVTSLQQAFQLDPAHLGANLGMAKLLVTVGQAARARAYLERVLQRAPEHQEARRLLEKV